MFFLHNVPWNFWICAFVSFINCGKFSVIITSNILCTFLYFLYSHCTCYSFLTVPQFLYILFFKLFLHFSFKSSYWQLPSLLILSLNMSIVNSTRGIFKNYYFSGYFFLIFPLYYFLDFPFSCLYTPSFFLKIHFL